jgi:SOS-response transcriptional repressor LexA
MKAEGPGHEVDEAQVSRWLNFKEAIPDKHLAAIAHACGRLLRDLRPERTGQVKFSETPPGYALQEQESGPILGTVAASRAGRRGAATLEPAAMDLDVFRVEVIDDSMEPTVFSGQILVVDRRMNVRSGDLAIVDLALDGDPEWVIKRVMIKDGRWTLKSVNAVCDDIPLSRAPRTAIAVWKVEYRPRYGG